MKQLESYILLVQQLFDVFKSGALSGEIGGYVRIDPQSRVLVFCLMLSSPSKHFFLLLQFVKTQPAGEEVGLPVVLGPKISVLVPIQEAFQKHPDP